MEKLSKNFIGKILIAVLFIFGFVGPIVALGATAPSLGATSTYGVVSSTYTGNVAATNITGDVCYTTGPGTFAPVITSGSLFVPCTNGADQNSALANINAQVLSSCISLGAGAVDLDAVDVGSGVGIFPAGCYTSGGNMNIAVNQSITLTGSGTHIFKPGGALTTQSDTSVALAGGASACNVFWAPVGATTLGAFTTGGIPPVDPTFVGTIFRGDAGGLSITFGHFAKLLGRALAFGSTVTTDANDISVPTCAAQGTINVLKVVVNKGLGTKVIADFPLFVNGVSVISGHTNSFDAPAAYTITETTNSNYVQTFSGDCVGGVANLTPGATNLCVVTNEYFASGQGGSTIVPIVAPIISIVKVPTPLALPNGPGQVIYTYTAHNIGTVPMSNVKLVGDTCSPINLVSGDINNDSILDVSETWIYSCSTMLSETHTNTVVATGWSNGISASDVASATVVVGVPAVVPPLIHVTKIPTPLALTKSGMVTYTERITNPGTVALNNVRLSDDKCNPMQFVSGDINNDAKLDMTETWTYTCSTNLTQTTTNTATAIGEANGLTARDFAVVTVVVAPIATPVVPKLPKTGFPPKENNTMNVVVISGILMLISGSLVVTLKKQKV